MTIALAAASAGVAMAGQQRPDRVSDQQLTALVNRIDTHSDAFHASLDRAIDRRPIDGSPARDQIDVTVRSSYRRVSDQARWDIDGSARSGRYANTDAAGDVIVADGTRLVAVLDNALSTTNAHEGDLYTMTIRSPSTYEGAVIQGVVSTSTQSGRLAGRSGITLNVRRIRLRDGRSHQFAGVIEGVRTPEGETIPVDRDAAVGNQDSEAGKPVERRAIGAALGAIIGAVAGRGQGAAIGAAVGAGAGAGTVLVEGRDRLDLQRGTEVTLTAGDPRHPRPTPGGR